MRVAIFLAIFATSAWAAPGRLVFVRGNALVSAAADGAGPATKIVDVPAPVKSLDASRDGGLITLDLGTSGSWIVDGKLHEGICTGRPRPSPKGDCLVCPTPEGTVLRSARRDVSRTLPPPMRDVNYFDEEVAELVAMTDQGIIAFRTGAPDERRLLAKAGARSHLIVSPSAERAVAVFGEPEKSRIYQFALDGEGVPRRLGGPGIPIGWSRDSKWVLLQAGLVPDDEGTEDEGEPEEGMNEASSPWLLAAPPRRWRPKKKAAIEPPLPKIPPMQACAVRAIGGESKCWTGYEPLGFSPDSTEVLLKKDNALYAGRIAGVRPETPRKLADDVDGPAAWLP